MEWETIDNSSPLWFHTLDWLPNGQSTSKPKRDSMWHITRRICVNGCTYIFKATKMNNHCHFMLWHSTSYLRTKFSPTSSFTMTTHPTILHTAFTTFFKMENPVLIPYLDELFNLQNNAVCQMNYWVCTAGTYRSISILERVHWGFFNYYQFHAMANIPDESVLARMMTALDIEFQRALH